MSIFRQYIAPFLILLVFLVALIAVGARSFLPGDMAAPAPVEEVSPQTSSAQTQPLKSLHADAGLPASLSTLIEGLPDDPALLPQLGVSVN